MKLRQIFEAPGKTAVVAFGRMNPPTIGHEKLVDVIRKQKGDHFLFLSHTQKPKTDPLPHNVKKQFAVNFFKGITIGDENVRTPIQMLQKLESMGYTDIIYVAGSDRVEQFDKLFNDYNGKEYNFNSIKVISAGDRDPDAEGAEGMSASKMRLAAAEGNFEAFVQGVPDKQLAKNLYQAVRTGMGIKELEPAENVEEGMRPEKPSKSSDELIAMGYAPDSDKVQRAKEYEDWVDDQRAKGKDIDEGELVLDKLSLVQYLRDQIYQYAMKEQDVEKLSKILKIIAGKTIKTRAGKRFTVSDEDIKEVLAVLERPLTKGEEKEKERLVKGMKKAKGDFKKRYGDDAEAVMYATATKMAKK